MKHTVLNAAATALLCGAAAFGFGVVLEMGITYSVGENVVTVSTAPIFSLDDRAMDGE